jgi:hypothetical protein
MGALSSSQSPLSFGPLRLPHSARGQAEAEAEAEGSLVAVNINCAARRRVHAPFYDPEERG